MAKSAVMIRSIFMSRSVRTQGSSTRAQRRSTKEYIMADEGNVKTPLDAMQDTLSRLKEMEHYSKTNIEKLAALWLEVSEHKEQKQYEPMVDEVLKCQNQFQESITSLIEAYEEETARLTSSTQ
jgi:hypothetical protein